jgi:hypothetical protein
VSQEEAGKAKGTFEVVSAHSVLLQVRRDGGSVGRRNKFHSLAKECSEVSRRRHRRGEVVEGELRWALPVINYWHAAQAEEGIMLGRKVRIGNEAIFLN